MLILSDPISSACNIRPVSLSLQPGLVFSGNLAEIQAWVPKTEQKAEQRYVQA
jgi:hypothetical protein